MSRPFVNWHSRLVRRTITAVAAVSAMVALGAAPASASGIAHAPAAAQLDGPTTTYTTPYGDKITLHTPATGPITNQTTSDGSKITTVPTKLGLIAITLTPPSAFSQRHASAVRPNDANACYDKTTDPLSDWCFTIAGHGTWVDNMINSVLNNTSVTLNIDNFIKFVPNGAILVDSYHTGVPAGWGYNVAWYPSWYVASGTYCGGATSGSLNSYLCLDVHP